MNRNFILSCFGLEEAKLSSCNEVFNEEDNVITYYIEFLRNTSCCPSFALPLGSYALDVTISLGLALT